MATAPTCVRQVAWIVRAPPVWAASTEGRFIVIAMSAPPRQSGRSLLHERRDVAQPRCDDGRLAQRAVHRLDRLQAVPGNAQDHVVLDRKSTRLNSSHRTISYAVFC